MNINETNNDENDVPEYESPLLNKLKETAQPFKEPENYFGNLRNEIFSKIHEDEEEERLIIGAYKRRVIRKIFSPTYAVAATILAAIILFIIHFMNNKLPEKEIAQTMVEDITTNENIRQIDEDVLIDFMDEEMIQELDADNENIISNEEIIDYLMEDDIDIATINEF